MLMYIVWEVSVYDPSKPSMYSLGSIRLRKHPRVSFGNCPSAVCLHFWEVSLFYFVQCWSWSLSPKGWLFLISERNWLTNFWIISLLAVVFVRLFLFLRKSIKSLACSIPNHIDVFCFFNCFHTSCNSSRLELTIYCAVLSHSSLVLL
jgi:hypothetical protein